jgi:hypothetical protein
MERLARGKSGGHNPTCAGAVFEHSLSERFRAQPASDARTRYEARPPT